MQPVRLFDRCRSMRLFILPAALLLAGFSFAPPQPELAAPAPAFVPEQFFLGTTEGKGVIRGPFGRHTDFQQTGAGRVDHDGTLLLEQRVHREGHDPEQRVWRIRKSGPGRYTGTLSDARGPVFAEVNGNCLHLRYTMANGGMAAEQYLYLQRDGRTALNRMTVRRFGFTFATVEETIRKVG